MEAKVKRLITKFSIGDEHRKSEFDVSHVPIGNLKKIFLPKANDPLIYDSYKLVIERASGLQQYIPERLDLDKFEYYLEAEAV